MSRLMRVICIGTFLVSCLTTVAFAQEETTPEPATPAPSEEKIATVNANGIYSYHDLKPDYFQQTPLPVRGLAMYYNPGIMQRVLKKQIGWGDVTECDECIGMVALLREGDMDRRVWLQRPGYPPEGPFWVVDQAAPRDVPGLVRRNWVVDVDYETAMRWRMRGPIPIIVLENPAQAVDYSVQKPSEPVSQASS